MVHKAAHTKIKGIYYLFLLVVVFLLSCKKPSPVKIGTVNGATAVCLGEDSVVYTLNATEAVDYVLWTVPKEAEITSGQGTGTITVKFGRVPGNICAILYNDGEPVSENACLNVSFGVAGKWCRETNFQPGGRSSAMSFSIGKKGYISTGFSNSGLNGTTEIFNDLWQYDTENSSWTQLAPLPDTPRIAAACFTIGNKAYLGTGFRGAGSSPDNFFNDFWEYDSDANTWAPLPSIPGPVRQYAFAFSIGNKGYVGGGQLGLSQLLTDFYEFNPATGTWLQKNDFPYPRISSVSFSIGNKGYIGTGQNGNATFFYNDFYEYDPVTDSWAPKASFPGAVRFSAEGFASNSKGYVGLGYSNAAAYNDFWEYNPVTDTWSQLPGLSQMRGNAMGFAVDNKVYLGMGNVTSSNVLNDWWVYTLN
ncbi:MAG: kelch repeat-containing protein [Bacteroidia bacterium]